MSFSSAFGSTSAFGSSPAPSSGFSFGNTAPAPSTTSPFGSAAPAAGAPSTGFAFGASSPSNTGFGSSAFGGFGSSSLVPGSNPAVAQQATVISAGTPYSMLPPDIRQAIDKIHEAMMNHKRTVNGLQSAGPSILLPCNKQSTALIPADGSNPVPLPQLIKRLQETINELESESRLQDLADACNDDYETLYKQGVQALWTVEALAIRRGVHLKAVPNERKLQEASSSLSTNSQLQIVLDRQMAHVDRLEAMPSPYLWQLLDDMKKRLTNLERRMWSVQQQSQNALGRDEQSKISEEIFRQMHQVTRAITLTEKLHLETEKLRNLYRFYEKGDNVLDKVHSKEQARERQLDDLILYQFVKASTTSTSQGQSAPAPAPPAGGGFGTLTTSTSTGANAPSSSFGGFGFGSPAPAAASFGSTTPASGLNAPAPAPPAFGSTSAAPAPGFGSTALPFSSSTSFASSTPKAKNKSRSKSRSGR